MEVELRNPGEKVWAIQDNKAMCGVIMDIKCNIVISSYDYETLMENVSYYVVFDITHKEWFDVSRLFNTKDELLKSL